MEKWFYVLIIVDIVSSILCVVLYLDLMFWKNQTKKWKDLYNIAKENRQTFESLSNSWKSLYEQLLWAWTDFLNYYPELKEQYEEQQNNKEKLKNYH